MATNEIRWCFNSMVKALLLIFHGRDILRKSKMWLGLALKASSCSAAEVFRVEPFLRLLHRQDSKKYKRSTSQVGSLLWHYFFTASI